MANLHEIWKDITGYEGHYQISNLGRVRSLDTMAPNGNHVLVKKWGQIRKISISKQGYFIVGLFKNNIQKTFKVHRLIAFAFIEKPSGKNIINHKDGNKLNNSIDNLEWCTYKENSVHAVLNNLINKARGERIGISVLTEAQAKEIKELCKTYKTEQIRRMLGFPRSKRHLIRSIKDNICWKHI